MRLFVSGPRLAGVRLGAILTRRAVRAALPWSLWRLPVALALGIGLVLAGVLAADFVSYMPR